MTVQKVHDNVIIERFDAEKMVWLDNCWVLRRGTHRVFNGMEEKISIAKQLQNYVLFHTLLIDRCRLKEQESRFPFPIIIYTQRFFRILYSIVVLLGIWGLANAFIESNTNKGIGAIGFILFGSAFWVLSYGKYLFNYDGLMVINLRRKKFYSAYQLERIRIDRTWARHAYHESAILRLVFSERTISIPDNVIDYPIEVLGHILANRYRKRFTINIDPRQICIEQ